MTCWNMLLAGGGGGEGGESTAVVAMWRPTRILLPCNIQLVVSIEFSILRADVYTKTNQ